MHEKHNARQKKVGTTVLNNFVDALDLDTVIDRIAEWGSRRESRTVCLCNVHSAVTATQNPALAQALANSDLVLPDGAPIAWMLRRKGFREQTRIAGPDLIAKLCDELQHSGSSIGIFLFGSSQSTLEFLTKNLNERFPDLDIKGALSPHYGEWTTTEENDYIDSINHSNAGIVFTGLGCPKQEIWMAKNRERIHGVLLGVGAAFDFHAGTIRRAPIIYQHLGLEWLYRLLSEPRRLWKRYLVTNSIFMLRATQELLRGR